MMGIIDDFLFEMDRVGYNSIKQKIVFGWSKQERLYNNPIHMKKNKSSSSLEIAGTLVMRKVYALDDLIAIAEQKRPVTLTLGGISRVYQVVILSIDIDRDIFLDTGEEMRKKFVMRVEQFYGKNS